ncbi:ABC transporter ATP-binding protein [uncultured Fusobacterium sp.]|uniref:ABC transporter ATP-binding protein n=1 Tax=uncultured Fusobacterium sp. TaxID=159267 RepID=UPI000BBB5024|nr:ABC transporter ATP-binding protein [uncultured Fusobacterium sp.]BBA51214.1 ABC transporter [Fusobacterium varium]
MLKMNLTDIKISYGKNNIIKNIKAEFYGGNVVSLIGPNGTGKTTLLKAIAHLIKYEGDIGVIGETGYKNFRDSFTYVPQMSVNNINLTVFEIVLLGRVRDLTWKIEKIHLNAVAEILDELNLSHLSCSKFSSLSGGQKQMVIMAQAMVSKPKILLLDEPTSALDLKHQLQIMETAKKYTKKTGSITVIVLHDIALAARYSDEILLLHDGYSIQQGIPEEVLKEELLEDIYGVELDISKSSRGFISITPIKTK